MIVSIISCTNVDISLLVLWIVLCASSMMYDYVLHFTNKYILTLELLALFQPTLPAQGVGEVFLRIEINIDHRIVYLICMCRYFNFVSNIYLKLISAKYCCHNNSLYQYMRILKCAQKYNFLYISVLN